MSKYPLKKLSEICEIEYWTRVVNKRDGGSIYSVYGWWWATFFMDDYNREDRMVIARFAMSEQCTRFIVGKFFLNDSGLTVSTKNKEELSQVFLDLYLFSLNDFIYSLGRWTAQKNLNVEKFRDIQIPLPPLSTQLDIVARLNSAMTEIDALREQTESALASIRELWESYLDNLEGEKITLWSLVDIRTGKLNANAMKEDGIYPFFTCAKEIYKIDTFAFDCEAILLAWNNAVWDFNVKHYKGKFNAYQRTYVITVNEQNRILYRYLYFQLVKSLDEFKKKSVGAGTKFLKLWMIQNIEIICPPLTEQSRIVAHLDTVQSETEKLEKLNTEKLANLEELRKSVLQEAFS